MFKKYFKVIIFVAIVISIGIYINSDNNDLFTTYDASYVINNDKILLITSDDDDVENIDTFAKENENLEVTNSSSLINFNPDDDAVNNAKEEMKIKTVKAYKVTIDDSHEFYISDVSTFETAFNNILKSYLTDAAFNVYQKTGSIPVFEKNGKSYSEFYISSKIEVNEGYYNENLIQDDVATIQYELLNGENTPEYAYITENNSLDQILQTYNLTESEFELNNPGINDYTLLYNGQRVVVNNVEPTFKMVGYYESIEKRDIEFQQFDEPNDSMYKGETEVKTEGEKGVEQLHYRNREINGQIVSQDVLDNVVLKQPVNEVTYVGTKEQVTVESTESFEGDGGYDFVDGTGNFAWPSVCRTITNGYLGYSGHYAIDIQCGYGTPVYAADNGTVVTSGYSGYGYGNYVVIDHNNGYRTLYGHMAQRPNVSVGQSVIRGEVIGYEGNSGNSTGHHLHYEIQVVDGSGNVISKPNPLNFY